MAERLIYLPLGGAGEIGMNAYVYGYGQPGRERLIVVDLGVTFGDMDSAPGIDLIMADVAWLEANRDRIDAIFITHGHEDHVGALGLLWPRLQKPVHCRRFTGALARLKLEEAGQPVDQLHIHAPRPDVVTAGPFRVQFVPISHSIPESSALIIDTPAGRIVHTGDFKLDGTPVVGEAFDPILWHDIANEGQGIKVLTCDSTNVFSPHPGRSEAVLANPLLDFVMAQRQMVVATTFASNIARLKTLAEAGVAAGRKICLLGRAMRRMVTVGVETGILTNFPSFIGPEEASELPRDKVMLIVTGSQGERRAASAQLSRGRYLGIELKEGDSFLFSSRTIPGNERGVIRIMNALSEMGVDLYDAEDGLYHVSGHANRPDIEAVHDLLKPQIVIPMHGEHMHLREHAKLAEARGIPSVVATNGTMLDLSGTAPRVVDQIDTGRLYLDGTMLIGAMDGVVRDRIRMALNGRAMVSVIIDEDDSPLPDAWVELSGLPELGRAGVPLARNIEGELAEFLERADDRTVMDDDRLEEAIRKITRQVSMEEIGKKPEVTVVISRLAAE
ncbi:MULTISPECIES: ribonuclease J [Paracoccus]|jgi:ribonuclease J|uniref:Beta-lactamase domain protein n=1 Tax=Paracoccus denitrificans (strain Pd 1222) TaxID=318586 RepID=A1B476_PARDP|nr:MULTISPECIES: ribonuclease J [Paracoccus]ABL70320.1 beta-lactamase domain protein [Paracoccus denitrificans PD1222]MBB4627229.1 ribonuclease J [Paracoccus denitrificans]MCU7427998.1 ribonuclease J [Paracoccus denitrificans]MDK8874042.1 ribonuclease J [Paracoccus sp. SSJ]QAR25670.1 ribonuclease J [Paracoccus denitrificans]